MPPKQKPDLKSEEECITLTQVNELMQQQREMFLALLQQQQENFKGFVKIILDSTNTRMDDISKEVQEIKASIHYTQKEVDDIKMGIIKQTDHCKDMQSEIFKICESLLAATDKLDYLEGQSRRNNLIIDGIEETPGETWADSEEKVKRVLVEKLQLQGTIEVERAHRAGKLVSGGSRTRPIVVKFVKYKDRSMILQRAKCLKGSMIYINEDYTDAEKKRTDA